MPVAKRPKPAAAVVARNPGVKVISKDSSEETDSELWSSSEDDEDSAPGEGGGEGGGGGGASDDAGSMADVVAHVKETVPLIKSSPHTDLKRGLQEKADAERESFLLMLQDNVRLNREHKEFKNNYERAKEEVRQLKQTNAAILNNNTLLVNQVADTRKEMSDLIESAMKAKEKAEAQISLTTEDMVHLDTWPNESPAGKLWFTRVSGYDSKFNDLHNKIKLLSCDAINRNQDYHDLKQRQDNILFLNQKFKERLTTNQLNLITEEIGDIGKYERVTGNRDDNVTIDDVIRQSSSSVCLIM